MSAHARDFAEDEGGARPRGLIDRLGQYGFGFLDGRRQVPLLSGEARERQPWLWIERFQGGNQTQCIAGEIGVRG